MIDPETGEFWIRATEVGGVHVNIRSDERDPHPERASVRRSIRSLHRRGLVEARVMTVTTPQRDPDRYEVLHLIPRTALVARLTPAGMEYLEQRVGPYPY
ncbi:hypothetical protein ABZ413_17375 [Nocardia rhamnosiphila]|uniref:hypothetical protein n=1 Tax=Nocardia rhamnosiphila TaxID=426716 RepID=UPI0033D53E57